MIHLSKLLCAFWVVALFAIPAVAADSRDTRLPTMLVEDSAPMDLLNQDPLLPIQEGEGSLVNGNGNSQKSLLDQVPLNSTSYGKAGTLSQFRGLGRSADDTQIQTLGVPLNPPQGGGFDFATFPQYLWSDFRFQLAPGLAALDPRANSGVITLVPWTQKVLGSNGSRARLTGFGGTSSLAQFSAGLRLTEDFALLTGRSVGAATGTSGSISGKWGAGGRVHGQYHLLVTDIENELPGPIQARTPEARQRTVRYVPILQADVDLARDLLLKSSFHYDSIYLRTETPENRERGRDHILQGGVDAALVARGSSGDLKLGASVRRDTLNSDFVSQDPVNGFVARAAAGETLASVQLAPVWDLGSVQVSPTLQGVSLTGFGFLPAGSLGLRVPLSSDQALFARGALSRRYPSLSDRFYNAGPIQANADLAVEKDWTAVLGWEFPGKALQVEVSLYGQKRQNAIQGVPGASGYTTVNLGDARVESLLHSVRYVAGAHVAIHESGSYTHSRVEKTGLPFPYQPKLTQLLAVDVADQIEDPCWKGSLVGRAQSRVLAPIFRTLPVFFSDAKAELPAISYLDLQGQVEVFRSSSSGGGSKVDLIVLVENVLNQSLEFQRDYPSEGRALSVGVVGQF